MAPRSGARELTMKKALEAIESGNRSNGATGLENLIHIFKHQATASDLLKLDDKSYHRLFEAIFRYTLTEKEAYYHGKGAKSVALGRLSKCAEVLRLSVEHGASKVKRKTFLAVVDHIADILPHPDDGLVPPLVADYIKALATLLGHGANVEILATHNSDGWYTCVDFVVDTITHYAGNDDRDTGVPRASPAPSASSAPSAPLAPLAGPSPGLQLSTPRSLNSNKRNNGNERPLRGQLSDLMECLSYLVSASNAPVLQRSKEIASVALHVLQLRYLGLSQLHQLAFAVINALLVATQTDDTAQASSMAVECLPLIIYWWQAKAASKYDALLNAVRMEMLKVLYNIRLQLEFLARKHLEDTTLFEYIENLLEVLWSEYSKRDERAQLQQDDLAYAASHVATNYFRIQSFTLRPFNIEGERQWAVVQIIAMLESITWKRSRTSALDGNNDNSEQPRKKQRKDVGFGRLRHKLRSIDPSTQFTTLQMIPFFVSDVEVTVEEAYDLLSILLGLVTNRDSRLSTWAIIASASLCVKSAAADHSLNGLWRQTWQVAVRSVSMTGTCRAASFLLYSIATNNLLSYSEIMGDISDMVTTADVNGPAVLVDSSLLLMTALLQLRNHHLPNASHATNNHIVRWMLSRWYPADATFITSYSMHVSPLNIANLIRAACGERELSVSDVCQTISGPISETLLLLHERESVVKYLLLLEDGASSLKSESSLRKTTPPRINAILTDSTSALATTKLVAELFYAKLEEVSVLCLSWAKKTEGTGLLTPEKLQSVFSCLVLGALILPQLKVVNTRQSQETENIVFRTLRDLLEALSSLPESQSLYEYLLRFLRAYMPEFNSTDLSRFLVDLPYLHRLFADVSMALRRQHDQHSIAQNSDAMDIDDDFESQGSRPSALSNIIDSPRRESLVVIQASSFYNDTARRLHFIQQLSTDAVQVRLISTEFIGALMLLPDSELLSCRCFIRELFNSDLAVSPDDAQKVIERMGTLIGQLTFLSCEVALNICLDLMEGFITMWSDGNTELSSLIGDLYRYYLGKGLTSNLLSPKVRISLSRLLLRLAQVGENFHETVDMDPPNTSLLDILENSSLPVKFYIGSRLPSMFGRYILKIHEDMFVNILESLPTSNGFREGIALRLFVLGEVAREWPTLLRRGIYHIFETPGKVPSSKEHATYVLKRIAVTLELDDPRQLFDLFSSQLLYTWLDEGVVEDIPFEIFGFPDLEGLIHRTQADVVALMVMRAQDEALERLAQDIGTTSKELIQRNFSKTLAYSMAHDISMSKGEQQSGEGRLRKLLGREAFLENVYINFADIVGTFVALIDQEDPIERSWARDDNLANATEAMARIKKYGHSDVVLGANQQPTFRPKYLTREIALLCSRTEHELSTLWNPALVVSVARRLFNSIHRALGPLYACAVLRKVRVLICLAGPYAWKSYPLEMLLHYMRPYLVDTECADDCLGMSQFLLEKGYDALSKSPSFLAGYALTTLASLRVFLDTSQSSTTQESQFKATMSKARKFHEWFTKYLETYASSALKDGAQRDAFRVVTESAAHVRSSGNAERGTHESRLLLEILRDRDGGTSLLSEASHKLALEMLCRHFTMPATSSIDFLRSDEDARMLAKAVWRSCKSQKFNGEYLAWAGRVIGRSFASSGHIDDDLLRESQLSKYCRHAQGESASEQGILSLLQALTADSSHTKAGLAESALRTIVSEAIEQQDGGLMGACHAVLSDQLYDSSNWAPYRTPPSDDVFVCDLREDYMLLPDSIHHSNWAKNVAIHLVQDAPENIILSALSPILMNVEGFAKEAFPYIVHLTLLIERKSSQPARRKLSEALKKWFEMDSPIARDNICLLMNAILYLRTQPRPGENSIADRVQWLELDPTLASSAARKCGMHKTALLFIELSSSEGSRSSRRSSNVRAQESTDLLLDIFENIDDPDAYYGLSQIPSLPNVLSRLEYEKDGLKSLAFRGAQYDSHIRKGDAASVLDSQSLVGTLGGLGLSGLSNVLLRNQQSLDNSSSAVDSTFNTARKLEIWNLPALSSTRQPSVTIYKSYQALNQAAELAMVRRVAWSGFSELMQSVLQDDMSASSLRNHLGALAVLTEFNDTIDAVNSTELEQLLETFNNRSHWMKSGRYDEVGQILSCRDTTMSLLSQFANRSEMAKVNPPEARSIQVKSMLLSSSIHRYHQAFQESLNIATSLTHLVQPSADIGLSIDASARVEVANSLWDHGEMMSSIRTLQLIDEDTDLKKQTITVSRADLLAKTAHQISVARLEKPDSIHKNYLQPALKELRGKADGEEAGKVYHQFATFCDEQLQNPDSLEDLARLKHLRQGKLEEVKQLTKLIASAKDTHSKQRFTSHLARAKQWLGLDEQELRRVEQSRSEFVRLSLENYLLALVASDEYNNDALRFTALWLERALEDYTNEAVGRYIDRVPTRKFAPLMNQLTSRLLDQGSSFQRLLIELVYRICVDHPYHGMYQIWSGTKSKPKKEDEVAQLRKQATERVGKRLAHTETSAGIWTAIYHTSKAYHGLAVETSSYQGEYKGGEKHPITSSPAGQTLELALARFRIPPPTMQIQLSASRDYSSVPFITSLEPTMRIASGVSAPKIITIVGSNGEHFRQLVKGGNDDLRQDAIMEQVFAAVSSVLKLHRSTRQRNLGIRTYKVLPLTSVSGLIEFVSNTIPLHDYLMPAHEKYHPRDYKGSQCRKEIANVQTKSSDVRITTYKKVVDRFQPVMRYFFMEYFTDPDDWFAKRTAYTRTTAAISMLGHVLGLGDRHGHNILLDSKTGEVVHIDLGVAFESGRVLPVPELVPFRLTRDVVDGMGITKTEGVFRRCCEFTLDALREETYSIMTILDVLRYDPLYSWSISPLRVAKLQDPRRDEADAVPEAEIDSKKKSAATRSNGMVNEPSEADRALEVVRKKLSKTLSVTATVNDLINQATDERNLAVLYSGWAAYA
ncbi:phosphatidylinositol 3 [Xylaria sp. CBS 124048]|nr:phosphatidylinositol 3 [Xylaria sp. CBS 124048]